MNYLWNDFWYIIWLFFWGFVFVAYLVAIFAVFADIFRDHSLNGWAKAAWVLFLIFIPFLTLIVYVIARGDRLAESLSTQEDRSVPSEDYAQPKPFANPAGEIALAQQLLEKGTINQGEFDAIKNKAMGNRY